ncbi:plant basic secretory protein [Diplogelasinospora grovesii]|uniref:Plant basic secretory protein n=1 Tax=Diplogelasinospora grovesii TaxID=303347 RepID=A0AAN6S1Q2_9PEZI|nr:plant basic secretory protein [Diplogelasinospora grovesii]
MTIVEMNTTPSPNHPGAMFESAEEPMSRPDEGPVAPGPTPSALPVSVPPQPSNPPPPSSEKPNAGGSDKEEEDGVDFNRLKLRLRSRTGELMKDIEFDKPKLRLEIRDLHHAGTAKFLDAVNASTLLSRAVANVQRLLYHSPSDSTTYCPRTRSVTVILRDMGGVAYTTGTELDDDHKEIHFSLGYINGIQGPPERLADEINGVLTHELVHCYQWNAKGTCPGGLVEGIADWVRLRCGLSPPHWRQETTGEWDRGYQHTAYFLDYLEHRFGDGTVRRINEKLRLQKYDPKLFWTELLGRPVEQLWEDYASSVAERSKHYVDAGRERLQRMEILPETEESTT